MLGTELSCHEPTTELLHDELTTELLHNDTIIWFAVLLLLLLLLNWSQLRPGESENTLSLRRPQPHTTDPLKEEKDKIVGDK